MSGNKELVFQLCYLVYAITSSILKSCLNWILPMKRKSIARDVVLITGGNKGIGRNIALQFSKYKPKHIVLWGRDESSLKDVSAEIHKNGSHCSYMVCDVSNRKEVYSKAKQLENKIGPVTILVNNAGIVYGNNFIDSSDIDIERTFQVNTMAQFWTTKAFLPHMIQTNHGHIVCMSSLIGLISIPGIADYAASKFAITGFMESIGYELSAANKPGVHTTTIHPYLVDTDMFAGCTIRFPKLFPSLSKEYVARRTVDAVLRNDRMIIMPRIMYIILILKSILPVQCILIMQKFTGVDKTMTNFIGRKQKSL